MFVAIIAGYIVATLFAFCGIVNIIQLAISDLGSMDYFTFIDSLARHSWPLAVAAAVFLLVQACLLLERLCMKQAAPAMLLSNSGSTPCPPLTNMHKKTEDKEMPEFFHMESCSPAAASPDSSSAQTAEPTEAKETPSQAENNAEGQTREEEKPQLSFFKL